MDVKPKKDSRRMFRLRLPEDLKKWIAVSSAEQDTSQHDLIVAILGRFAQDPADIDKLTLSRKKTTGRKH